VIRTVLLAVVGLGAGALAAPAPVAALQGGDTPRFETTAVAEGVYRFRWQAHVAFFVVGERAVAAFDPLNPEAAAVYAREIRRVTDRPVRWIVYSHSDADHASGAAVLAEGTGGGAEIVATRAAVDDIMRRASPDQPPPTVTFERTLSLDLGGRTVELHYLGPNHSDNSLVALVPDARVAFAVDFVNADRVGFRDLPGWHFPGQTVSIRRMLGLDFDTVVFGHGPVGDRAAVFRQLEYWDALERAVRDAVRAGWTEDEAAARIRLERFADWGGYEDWFELNVRGAYRIIAGAEGGGR